MQIKIVFYAMLMVCFINGCKPNTQVPYQQYYYQFIGFDSSVEFESLLKEISHLHSQNDYIVTKNEALIAWKRSLPVPLDTLHQLHQVIHRLDSAPDLLQLNNNEIVIQIALVKSAANKKLAFEFKRYRVNNGALQQEFDFGVHTMPVSEKNMLNRVGYLAEKFAQVSFK
ncbi:MAG: hypothetical protein ACPGLV_13250 [Bacteroidia bacterium]